MLSGSIMKIMGGKRYGRNDVPNKGFCFVQHYVASAKEDGILRVLKIRIFPVDTQVFKI